MTTPPVIQRYGIDMMEWSDADEITRFEALQTVIAKMAELLQAPVKG